MTTKGSCHCGKISFVAEGAPAQVMECNCSHCARKGFLLWFIEPEQFQVIGDESAMTTYQFNKHNIEHRICPTCGVQPFARGKLPSGARKVAINMRSVPEFDRASVEVIPVDGKSF